MESLKKLPKPVQIGGLVIGVFVVGWLCVSTFSELTAEERAANESLERVNEARDRLDQFTK